MGLSGPLILLRVGRRNRAPCGLEQPRRSKMAWLKEWRSLVDSEDFEAILATCQFGSPHQKEFRFLVYESMVSCWQTWSGVAHVTTNMLGYKGASQKPRPFTLLRWACT